MVMVGGKLVCFSSAVLLQEKESKERSIVIDTPNIMRDDNNMIEYAIIDHLCVVYEVFLRLSLIKAHNKNKPYIKII